LVALSGVGGLAYLFALAARWICGANKCAKRGSGESVPRHCAQRLAYCWRAIKTYALSNEIKINKELQTSMTHNPARLQLAFVVCR